jgi:alkylated DNA repair dioxygenase AlkB
MLYRALSLRAAWHQQTLTIAGRPVKTPRLTAWYGEPEAVYRYSGVTVKPLPWLPELRSLTQQLSNELDHEFNSVLLNWYRNENDSVAWHADAEPELGSEPLIASISLGEERLFRLKPKDKRDKRRYDINLESGSLLVMSGELQSYWLHSVPKSKYPCGGRINLTFRKIVSSGSR